MTAVPFAVRFRRRIDAMVAQGQELLRTFRRLVESKISRRGTFRFIVAAMRHRIDALLPQGEVVVRTIHHLLGNLSPRKKVMAFVVAGVAGLALLLLLEISVRRELAAEARHVAIDTVSASAACGPIGCIRDYTVLGVFPDVWTTHSGAGTRPQTP